MVEATPDIQSDSSEKIRAKIIPFPGSERATSSPESGKDLFRREGDMFVLEDEAQSWLAFIKDKIAVLILDDEKQISTQIKAETESDLKASPEYQIVDKLIQAQKAFAEGTSPDYKELGDNLLEYFDTVSDEELKAEDKDSFLELMPGIKTEFEEEFTKWSSSKGRNALGIGVVSASLTAGADQISLTEHSSKSPRIEHLDSGESRDQIDSGEAMAEERSKEKTPAQKVENFFARPRSGKDWVASLEGLSVEAGQRLRGEKLTQHKMEIARFQQGIVKLILEARADSDEAVALTGQAIEKELTKMTKGFDYARNILTEGLVTVTLVDMLSKSEPFANAVVSALGSSQEGLLVSADGVVLGASHLVVDMGQNKPLLQIHVEPEEMQAIMTTYKQLEKKHTGDETQAANEFISTYVTQVDTQEGKERNYHFLEYGGEFDESAKPSLAEYEVKDMSKFTKRLKHRYGLDKKIITVLVHGPTKAKGIDPWTGIVKSNTSSDVLILEDLTTKALVEIINEKGNGNE